jgi:hypothetical protein
VPGGVGDAFAVTLDVPLPSAAPGRSPSCAASASGSESGRVLNPWNDTEDLA